MYEIAKMKGGTGLQGKKGNWVRIICKRHRKTNLFTYEDRSLKIVSESFPESRNFFLILV